MLTSFHDLTNLHDLTNPRVPAATTKSAHFQVVRSLQLSSVDDQLSWNIQENLSTLLCLKYKT